MWLCLPPVVSVVLIVVAYHWGSGAENELRANNEPVLSGIFVSLPFVILLCVEVLVALAVSECASWGSGTAWLTAASLAAGVIGALSLWQFRFGMDGLMRSSLAAAILLPLLPAWLSHAADHTGPR